MLHPKSLFTTFFFYTFFSITFLTGQDLIERAQLNLPREQSEKVNQIAKFVAKNWNNTIARNGNINLFELVTDLPDNVSSTGVSDAVYLNLNQENFIDILDQQPAQLSISIPVANQSFLDFDLVRVTGFDFPITLSSGTTPPSLKNAAFYRGIVKGNTNSFIALSIFEDEIMGVIADEYGNYVLGQIRGSSLYTLFNDDNYLEQFNFGCDFDSFSPEPGYQPEREAEAASRQSTQNCVKIYVETDYHSYGNLGSSTSSVTSFVTGAFNAVATIYQNEQIAIEISELKIWDTSDPYGGTKGANCGTVLNNFTNAMGSSFNGDLAHLITAIDPTGGYSVCGLAYFGCRCDGSVCNVQAFCNSFAPSTGYSQTLNTYQNYPTYNWTVNVLAHELGHNFGSPHTHACAWNGNNTAIDGCVGVERGSGFNSVCDTFSVGCSQIAPQNPGTIMSYCHRNYTIDFTLGFGQQPGDLIRSNYMNANCLTACTTNDLGDGICRSSMTITDDDIPGSTGNFRSASTIDTDNGNDVFVQSGDGTVQFLATTSVTLNPGFHAQQGADFTAKIEACSASLVAEEEESVSRYLTNVATLEELEELEKESQSASPLQSNSFLIQPNPARESALIIFDLEEASTVSLAIYNLNGQLVRQIFAEQRLDAGYYEIEHQKSLATEGLLYVSMMVNGTPTTKKMVFLN